MTNQPPTDFDFGPIPIDCEAAGPGSSCGVSTTANTFMPGAVLAAKHTTVQLFRARLIQPGAPAASQLVAQQGLAWPTSGLTSSGFHVCWVSGYKQCNSPNASHAPPLGGSCSPSALLDPNIKPGPSAGEWPLNLDYISGGSCPNGGGAPPSLPDVCIQTSASDVETAAGGSYDPSPGTAGSDLGAVIRMRINDNSSCTPTPCSGPYSANATTTDLDFGPIPIDCEGSSSDPGSDCNLTTTANTFMVGAVVAGEQTSVQLFRARLIQPSALAASHPFIPRKNVRGFVYDVATGTLREVEA